MILVESKIDLFRAPEHYYFAHCISSDFALGAGIAVQFCKRFDTRNELLRRYSRPDSPICLLTERTLNLVTKDRYWNKPSLYDMELALISMREVCISNSIKFVAMPAIGCGLDRLNWKDVKGLVESVFKDIDIKIVVCFL